MVLSSESIRFVRDIFAASADSINPCRAAQVAVRVSPPATQLIRLLMQAQERQHGVQHPDAYALKKSVALRGGFSVMTRQLRQLKKFRGMQTDEKD